MKIYLEGTKYILEPETDVEDRDLWNAAKNRDRVKLDVSSDINKDMVWVLKNVKNTLHATQMALEQAVERLEK